MSNVTGQLAGDDFASAAYWKRHVREAVRFADSVRFVHSAGANRFLEVGPGSGLTASIEETLASDPMVAPVTTMSALRKDRPEPVALVNAVAQGFVAGMEVDWRGALGELISKPISSSCLRMPLTGGAFGLPPTARRPMPRAWAWRPVNTPCWARWWNCRPPAEWC